MQSIKKITHGVRFNMIDNIEALLLGCMAISALLFICIKPKKIPPLKDNPQVRELAKYVGPNKVLTPYERKMFALINESVPKDYKVLCQVSFNAFLKCEDMSIRNKFNRSMVDYLIIDSNFIPVVCIELDDFTHNSDIAKAKDELRDNILSAALIPTVRFKGLPKSVRLVQSELNPIFKNHKKSDIYRKLIVLK